MLSITEILEVIKAVDQSSINRLELEQAATRLVIVKGGGLQSVPAASAELPRAAEREEALPQPPSGAACKETYHKIVAPMLGTFYAAPEPGAPAFVQAGQQVAAGTVVCVLEAMKLFNEVEAGIKGQIMEVLVKDGELVEYGQPLFLVKPE